ncbi:carboxynorspermidine decarboxylase [Maritalea sp.]|uniref:carboxynorspermidine decarboxylase n=1 Tax=Maritalea sp. TaxID=2003361 RepID=UPI003EF3F4D2
MNEVGLPQSGDEGAFAKFDLFSVPSPCFVVDEVAIERNLKILADIKAQSGANILLALKAFSMFSLSHLVRQYLDGTCASGLYEAKLASKHFGGSLTTYCAGYKASDLSEIIGLSDHLIFNSIAQKNRFLPIVEAARQDGKNISLGLRINPEHSEGHTAKYDPCMPCSRLGIPVSQLGADDLIGIDGLHMHTLCEQGFEPLERTWNAVLPKIELYLQELKWINFGGGHHITRPDYNRDGLIQFIKGIRSTYDVDVYLEPGEACALDAGILVGEILDLPVNQKQLAITDISATCHMPDVIEAPYRPAMLGETSDGPSYLMGGPSCLAGDVIGEYRPAEVFEIGDRFAFLDQAHYSMVKTNTFNGVPLPALAIWNSSTNKTRIVKQFTYDDFEQRLS